jgi:hypothetical protein
MITIVEITAAEFLVFEVFRCFNKLGNHSRKIVGATFCTRFDEEFLKLFLISSMFRRLSVTVVVVVAVVVVAAVVVVV